MNIAVVGAGNMGGALGTLWAGAGHQIVFSYSRDEEKLKQLAESAGKNARFAKPSEAVGQSEVVMIAVMPFVLADVLKAAGSLAGKTVITCVSGLRPDFEGKTMGLATDLEISIAETIQKEAPDAKVVEAFNLTFAEIVASDSRTMAGEKPTIFYCGDDVEAKKTVSQLVEDCGYEAVDAGALIVARSLETLASAWVQFAAASQLFPNVGIKALRR